MRKDPIIADMQYSGIGIEAITDGTSILLFDKEAEQIRDIINKWKPGTVFRSTFDGLLDVAQEFEIREVKPSKEYVAESDSTAIQYQYEVELFLSHAGKDDKTMIKFVLRKVYSSWRMSIQANPTSLLAGNNIRYVDLVELSAKEQDLKMFQIPFIIARRLFRAVDKKFKWAPETKKNITKGLIRVYNTQFAFYLSNLGTDEGPVSSEEFLHILEAVYSAGDMFVSGNNKVSWSTVARLLNVNFQSFYESDKERIESVTLSAKYGSNPMMQTCFYIKSYLLEKQGKEVPKGIDGKVRVDITLQRPGLAKMCRAAKLRADIDEKDITAKDIVESIALLKKNYEGGFVNWLRDFSFDEHFHIGTLLNPQDSTRKVQQILSINKRRLSFYHKMLKGQPLDAVIRGSDMSTDLAAALRRDFKTAGLPTNLPLKALDLLEQSTLRWGLKDKDRPRYSVLYAKKKKLHKILQKFEDGKLDIDLEQVDEYMIKLASVERKMTVLANKGRRVVEAKMDQVSKVLQESLSIENLSAPRKKIGRA